MAKNTTGGVINDTTKRTAKTPAVRRNRAPEDSGSTPTTPIVHTFESRLGMQFEYEEVEAPSLTRFRTESVNPHLGGLKKAAEMKNSGKALRTGPIPTAEIKKHENWLRNGGKALDCTIRLKVEPVEGTDDARISFWAVDRIVKPNARKKATVAVTAEDTPEAEQVTAAEAGF